jgi:DNA-binding NtrC family response regulator
VGPDNRREIEETLRRLELRTRLLEERLLIDDDAAGMIEASVSAPMRRVVAEARQGAPTDAPVLLSGEPGTGKTLLAQAIHAWSRRREESMVRMHCAAVPPGLLESELFGVATDRRSGRLRMADEGTLLLEEIADLPLGLQRRFLRTLRDGANVRVIATTSAAPGETVESGRLREDLYYRLAVFPISVPPLRERGPDIPIIARSFLDRLARRRGRGPWRLTDRALDWLLEQPWPGNIRELLNLLERETILSTDAVLDPGAGSILVESVRATDRPEEPVSTLREAERRHILLALERTGGRVHGPDGAARLLDVNASTLRSRMKKLGIAGARELRRRMS